MVIVMVCAALALMVVLALVVSWWLGRGTLAEELARRLVLVTMTDDQGFQGVLWASDRSGLRMVAAADMAVELITVDGERQQVDGQVFVPADRVAFIQVLAGGG